MSYSFTEEMLSEAVIRADRYIIAALPADNEAVHAFSGRFERKMRKLIRRSRIKIPVSKPVPNHKRFVLIAAAISVLLASVMSVSAVRTKILFFVTEIYEKYTRLFFQDSQPNRAADQEFTACIPAYIPEGFKLYNSDMNGIVLLEYEKGGDSITYIQQRADEISMQINTEGVKLEELEFNGINAKYYSNMGIQNLIWYDERYLYMVSSTLGRDIVLKIAGSVEPGN